MISREKHDRMANAIRFLSMDAVEKANSGHPGLPMGAADIATVLFTRYLSFDPKNPSWPNRDRFVLSAGHGSMLLYSLLYLTGYEDITIDEIKNFRQLGARTAGHPEYGHAAGIETTTGPLGQGIANAVGMAIAERKLRDEFGSDLMEHYTYVLAGDGCLMEGISQEAISLAGHLKLNKLIVFWDDNNISIDGPISIADSTDQHARFRACNWNTITVDGHDPDAIAAAIEQAQKSDKPTMIAAKTTIGFGAPNKAGTHKVHGSPLGAEEIAATRKALGWEAEAFVVPSDVLDAWRLAGLRSTKARKEWEERLETSEAEKKAQFVRRFSGELEGRLASAIDDYKKKLAETKPSPATRKASEDALEVINGVLAETIGGSADLTGSNNTKTSQTKSITPDDFSGRYIHYGVREHGMAAAMNGMALHGGVIPYSGGFLIFSDYCRPSIRLAALMGIRVIHVLTHDSIGLGEDGPTHQPVEHMAALRAIPNLLMFRPADATETAECWQLALESHNRPSGIALTRQNLMAVRTEYEEENLCARGAYDLISAADAKVTIFATGSEVEIAVKACQALTAKGISTRVVSVPCFELFAEQSEDYQQAIIGNSPVKIAVEAGIRQGWDHFIGSDGAFIGMSSFGASGPYKDLYKHFGITPEAVVAAAEAKPAFFVPRHPDRERPDMTVKVAINGFGRIGRNVLRAIVESGRTDIEVVAINDLGPVETNAHLLRYDSIHGRFPAEVKVEGDTITVGGGKPIKVTAIKDPATLPHKELGVDIAMECTGIFTARDKAAAHLTAGAKRVIVSAPADGADLTVVYGVNHDQLTKDHLVISNASCTTNCLVPVVKVLNDVVGIDHGFMTTIHSYTNDQPSLDQMHKDLYRARAAALSMIPTSTGAAKAVGLVLPELKGKLDGTSIRVPTPNVSVVDFKFVAKRNTSVEEITNAIKAAANGALKGVLGYTEEPLVSRDFNHDSHSSIFAIDQTKVIEGNFVRILTWYDNEWGFSNRMADTAVAFAKLI